MSLLPERLEGALALLRAQARPAALDGMARFGMATEQRLGLSVPQMRAAAKTIGRDHALALALWQSGIADAQIVASLVADPALMTAAEMDGWVKTMRSWDVCDGACLNCFVRSPLAWRKLPQWARRRGEFERRAGFALLAVLAVHDKAAADAAFIGALPLIESAADDERNFVRKAVNWALRQIGKRNAALHADAIATAERILAAGPRSARWVASDALRELRSRTPPA